MTADEQRRAENFAIPLTQGQVALVSEEDYERVSHLKWFARKGPHGWYALRNFQGDNGKRRTIGLHRFIMGTAEISPQVVQVDHVNSDGLDNRRENLRICEQSLNQGNSRKRKYNSSGFKGVSRNGSKWRAYIQRDKQWRHIGNYATPEEAHRAYCEAAQKEFGEFARAA